MKKMFLLFGVMALFVVFSSSSVFENPSPVKTNASVEMGSTFSTTAYCEVNGKLWNYKVTIESTDVCGDREYFVIEMASQGLCGATRIKIGSNYYYGRSDDDWRSEYKYSFSNCGNKYYLSF